MKHRYKYDWNIKDFLYNLFRSFSCLFSCLLKRKNSFNLKNRLTLYDRGEEKFIQEFDAVYYARNMRNIKAIAKSFQTNMKEFMLMYQKANCISLTSDSDDEPSEGFYDIVPPRFASEDQKRNAEDKIDKFMVRRRLTFRLSLEMRSLSVMSLRCCMEYVPRRSWQVMAKYESLEKQIEFLEREGDSREQ